MKKGVFSFFFQDNAYIRSSEYKEWREKCKLLYSKQNQNGGIIDLEYERTKFLIPSSVTDTCFLIRINFIRILG